MELRVVKYSKKIKRVSLQRFLITKIVLEVDKIRDRDVFALFDNQLWLERKCLSDVDFSTKFGKSLEEISIILKKINLGQGLSISTLRRISSQLKTSLSQFLIPSRNYQSFKSRFDGHFHLLTLKTPQEANKNIPPKRTIGVGYRDKGTARNVAKDGSPSWQEVASSDGQILLAIERIRNATKFSDFESVFKDLYGTKPVEKGTNILSIDSAEKSQR